MKANFSTLIRVNRVQLEDLVTLWGVLVRNVQPPLIVIYIHQLTDAKTVQMDLLVLEKVIKWHVQQINTLLMVTHVLVGMTG